MLSDDLFEGLAPPLEARARRLRDAGTVDDLVELLELLDEAPGPGLERFAEQLEPHANTSDDHQAIAARAALRMGNRLRETKPAEALRWLERSLVLSDDSRTQELASLWSTAALRFSRRRDEQDPSALLELSRQLLARAARFPEDFALINNTLDIACGTMVRLNGTGRFAEAQELAATVATVPIDLKNELQVGFAAGVLMENGFSARKEDKLELAATRLAGARDLYARSRQGRRHAKDLAWLIAEQLYVASLQGDAQAMLTFAEDFERELPEKALAPQARKDVADERQYLRAHRADALVKLGRLDEADEALETVKASKPNVGSLVGMVRARLAWARGDQPAARKHAQAVLKKFGAHGHDCHDDLDAARELLARA